MRHRDIKIGMKVRHRLPGDGDGKYLGTVVRITGQLINIEGPNGEQQLATPGEIKPA
jgi:hypothetical protein